MKEINFSPELKSLLTRCPAEAARYNSPTIAPQIVLALLLEDTRSKVSAAIARISRVPVAELQRRLTDYIESYAPSTPVTTVSSDPRTDRAIRLSALEASAMKSDMVCPEHLLLGIFHISQQQNEAFINLFTEENVDYSGLQSTLRAMLKSEPTPDTDMNPESAGQPPMSAFGSDDDDDDDDGAEAFGNDNRQQAPRSSGTRSSSRKTTDTPALDKFGVDMTKAAEEDRLDPVIGREMEIERLAQILSRRKKNNPVLIGEPGVGKSRGLPCV